MPAADAKVGFYEGEEQKSASLSGAPSVSAGRLPAALKLAAEKHHNVHNRLHKEMKEQREKDWQKAFAEKSGGQWKLAREIERQEKIVKDEKMVGVSRMKFNVLF